MTDERDQGIVDAMTSLEDNAGTLRLFARSGNNTGGYFVVGHWAPLVAQQFVKSSTVLKNWGQSATKPLMCVHINEALGREVIREALLHLGAAVEVFDRPSGGGPYSCKKRGTPGNASAFEDVLFASGDVEVQLMSFGAVWISAPESGKVQVGFAYANATLRTINVAQFADTEQLVHLDALVTQCNLKEVYASATNGAEVQKSLRRITGAAGVSLTDVPAKLFVSAETVRKVQALLRVQESTLMLTDAPHTLPALNCLLMQSNLAMDDSNLRAFTLSRLHPESFLRLDTAAVSALNIVASGAEAGKGKLPISIYGWLNQCSSGMGSRLMRQWILQPLRSAAEINARLDIIEVMSEVAAVRDSIREALRSCLDMDRLNKKLQRGTCSLREVFSLLGFVNSIPNIAKILEGCSHSRHYPLIHANYVEPLHQMHAEMENLTILIEASLECIPHSTRMKPEFDDDLMELDRVRNDLLADIEKEFNSILSKHGWSDKTLKLEQHASYGYVMRVSRKDDQEVRENKKFQTINTSKDGVRFTTERLSAANHQYKAVIADYDRRTLSLQKQLVETVATYLPLLDVVKEKLADLDVFTTVAAIVRMSRHPMSRPTIIEGASASQDGTVQFVNLRHPLVEVRQAEFVPNTVSMTSERNALIITGPNMGGKSTLMRSVGIGVVLAQAGFFVPAESATVAIRDAVLCRVGASDHMAQGVSTFMVEMLESASILAAATRSSLVIIDELGRGTSTFDGFGLAWAIAHEVACNIHASLLFSTHFHEMTELADEFANIANVHVGAETPADDTSKLRFTYKLEPGPCGRSFGILVAELAKMPKAIIDEAKRKAAEMEDFGGRDALQGTAAATTTTHMLNALPQEVAQRLTKLAQRVHKATATSLSVEASAAELELIRREIAADASLRALFGA